MGKYVERGTDPACLYRVKSVTGEVLLIFEDHIELTQEGVRGTLTKGLAGSKSYFYPDITSIQFKNCGWTNGFIEFTFAGGVDAKGGAWSFGNDNRFTFGRPTIGQAKKMAAEMEEVAAFLQEKIKGAKSAAGNQPGVSSADEILKYKQLLDSGIITQEEFDAKKKQLLNL